MTNVKLKATDSSINTGSTDGAVFADLFVVERYLKETEIKTVSTMWINIKDNQEVVDDIVDEYLDMIENEEIYYY